MHAVLPAIVLSLASLIPVAPQTTPAAQTGTTPPRPIRQVKPSYTEDAMRAKVEGTVIAECVVQADGTVGDVRVIKSLEPSLDDEAVKAARQWRFVPGTKDGVAVPMVITIELAFHLVTGRPPNPVLAWPALFAAAAGAPDAPSGTWIEETMEAPGVQVQFAHQAGWRVVHSTSPNLWFSAQNAGVTRMVIVSRPHPRVPLSPDPGSAPAAQQMANQITRQLQAMGSKARLNGTGRVEMGGRFWLWYDVSAPGDDTSMSAVAAHFPGGLDTIRAWTFTTGDGATAVEVMCVVVRPRGAPGADGQEEEKAAPEFGAMLRRLSIVFR